MRAAVANAAETSGPSLRLDERMFLAMVCILAGAPTVKIGLIQPLESFLLIHLLVLFSIFILQGLRFRMTPLWREFGIPNACFLLFATILACFALRLRFYPIDGEPSLLKQPLFISLSRLIEYFIVSFYMIYVANKFRRNRRALIFSLRAFVFTGVCSAAYGLLSFPILLKTGIELGAYGWDCRVRGFFNEGGPFGLYLMSVFLCGMLLVRFNSLRKRSLIVSGVVILPAFVLSQSKAAIGAVLLVLCSLFFSEKSLWKKLLVVILVLALVGAGALNGNVSGSVAGYLASLTDGDSVGAQDASPYGFVGRVAAFFLIPRMIAAHPLTGIGLGNYPIMRNDPGYLQGFPPSTIWDLSGAGVFCYAAELGIPLCFFLVGVLLLPLKASIRYGAPTLVKVMAAFQPIVLLFGVQIHFFYPWLCSAFALGALSFVVLPPQLGEQSCRSRKVAS